MVIFLPGVLPVFLFNAAGFQLVLHAAGFQPLFEQGQDLGRVFVRGQVHVHLYNIARLIQQVLLDQVHMGDLPCLLFQVAVVLNINAAVGYHGSNRFGGFGILLRYGNLDIGPFHRKNPPACVVGSFSIILNFVTNGKGRLP